MEGRDQRSLTPKELNDILTDQERTLKLFRSVAWQTLAGQQDELAEEIPEVSAAAQQVLEAITISSIESHIKQVFLHAESPIERAFLNAVMLKMSIEDTLSVEMYGPVDDLDSYMANVVEEYDGFIRWMGAFFYYRNARTIFAAQEELDRWLEAGRMPKEAYDNALHLLGAGLLDFINAFNVMIQPTMTLKGKSIRPDLAIWVPADPSVRIVVECDGFDYHSDKAAFQRDRIRDRQLMEAGFRVRRYSGSEIYKDPIKAGRDLVDYLHSLPLVRRPRLQEEALAELARIEEERGPNPVD